MNGATYSQNYQHPPWRVKWINALARLNHRLIHQTKEAKVNWRVGSTAKEFWNLLSFPVLLGLSVLMLLVGLLDYVLRRMGLPKDVAFYLSITILLTALTWR